MPVTVRDLCATMERLQLLSSRELESLHTRWFRPDRKDAEDPARFCQWLRGNNYLSEFAVQLLSQGQGEQLVVNQYRVRDQIHSGPLAGAYLATDPLQHPVVIQFVSTTVASEPARLAQLQRIVRDATQFQHPNVCRVLELGESNGRHYLVREYDEAATLTETLKRRGKLSPDQSTRIFALAFEGLRALHEHHLPGGVLTSDCILLATIGKGAKPQRTVRILVAAARADVFDSAAIGGRSTLDVPDEGGLVPLSGQWQAPSQLAPPEEDILRLGCLLYRCLTGREPYPADQLPRPSQPAQPISELAPEVPPMLAEIAEEAIDVDPARRSRSAAHVAKALRVYLRAETENKVVHAEEAVVISEAAPHRPPPEYQHEDEDENEDEDEQRQPRGRRRAQGEGSETALGKLQEVWAELRPQPRELVYLGAGAVGMILLILLIEIFSGFHFVHLALLMTGAAVTFLVQWLIRWWEERSAGAHEPRRAS